MQTPVYAIASHAISALGDGVESHWDAVLNNRSGVALHEDSSLGAQPVWVGKISSDANWKANADLSAFEQLARYSAHQALQDGPSVSLEDTVLVLATTKGSIEWLGKVPDERVALHRSAAILAQALCISRKPVVVSHACVSGVTALLHAARMIGAGRCKHALVVGADRLSNFVLSGFRSFQALAPTACKPFDAARAGINLGEAAASILLSSDPGLHPLARLCGGGTSNDANHISGPSRTGVELAHAIGLALGEAGIGPAGIAAVSAHGTATLYNDEMESKAFAHAGLLHAEVHSLKGFVGHTLGAAGVLESILCIESLRRNTCIPSHGFEALGVSQPLNVTREPKPLPGDFVLKTASGFGGCNAAAVWSRAR